MTASAAATEHAITLHAPAIVLNYGSAGSHVRDIFPGDIVIATRVIACNTLQILASGEELFIDKQFRVDREPNHRGGSIVECERSMVALAQSCAESWRSDPWPDRSPHGVTMEREPSVRLGPVISADMWVQSPARIDTLHRRHQSLAADMEAAAIAQVAYMHEVPFFSIKDISNNELYVNTAIQLGEITVPLESVGARSASLMFEVLQRVAGQDS